MFKKSSTNKEFIIFTGGGSGGHVFPNKPLIDHYKLTHDIVYVGTKNGVEKDIVSSWGVTYRQISAGKLRRYFDIQNIVDVFRFAVGVLQALVIVFQTKPKFIFSKGGFVSVPVCLSGWVLRVPVYIHEADKTPGLANRIASRFATHVFLTFPPDNKPDYPYTVSGLPMRTEIYFADKEKAKKFLGLRSEKPILLVLGGSLGSTNINTVVRDNLEGLLQTFTVVHSTGAGKLDTSTHNPGYVQKEFIKDEIFDCIDAADVVVSRAGAGGMMELLTLKKPTLFIPLGLDQSRGDQIENIEYVKKHTIGKVLLEEDMNDNAFVQNILELYSQKDIYIKNIEALHLQNAAQVIIKTIAV